MNKLSKMPVTCMFSLLIIAIPQNNAIKTVQQSAKDKEDTCRRADARQRYLPKKSSVSIRFDKNRHTEDFRFRYCPLNSI